MKSASIIHFDILLHSFSSKRPSIKNKKEKKSMKRKRTNEMEVCALFLLNYLYSFLIERIYALCVILDFILIVKRAIVMLFHLEIMLIIFINFNNIVIRITITCTDIITL